MKLKLIVNVLIFCGLIISTQAIVSAQAVRYTTQIKISNDVNRTHIGVGDINRTIIDNNSVLGQPVQNINNSHIKVGDINRDTYIDTDTVIVVEVPDVVVVQPGRSAKRTDEIIRRP
jgi:hypothetical protein